MRLAMLAVLVVSTLPMAGQSAVPAGQVHCNLQAPPPAATELGASPTELVYAGVVRTQLEAGQFAQAGVTAGRAVTSFPASALAESLLGDAELRAGHIPEASAAYTKAVNTDRCSARGHFGLGRLEQMTGRREAGEHDLSVARRLSPDDPEIAAANLELLPLKQRGAPLQVFLAKNPKLPQELLATLQTESATLHDEAFCSLAEATPITRLSLQPVMVNGRTVRSWGLKTQVNSADAALLEFDPSVSGIVLNQRDALKAGVTPVRGEGSPNAAFTAIADKVRIGSLVYSGCPVTVVPDRYLGGANSLIGMDFFRDHLIHIDYVDQSVTLSPFPARPGTMPAGGAFVPAEEKDWSPVYVVGPNILLPSLINKKGPFLLALDMGAGRTVIAPAVLKEVLNGSRDATLPILGTSGRIVKFVPKDGGPEQFRTDLDDEAGTLIPVKTPVKLPILRFTMNETSSVDAISFNLAPKSQSLGVELSGLLGFDVLYAFFVDVNYRDALARIQFDVNRRYAVRYFEQHF